MTRSARYHWRTNLAILLGVAAAVSVLAGALVVGDSVRGSLRDIALGRLGRTDLVLSSVGFFREELSEDLRKGLGASDAAPIVVANGFVTLESSGRRAANVFVYGVDDRFWTFHQLPAPDGVYVSPALAAEVGARDGDVLLTRLQKPSEIPVESLFGRKEDVGRTVRLMLAGVLPRDRLGEFALRPQQTDVRAVFAPLGRIQRDLAVAGQVNTILVAGGTQNAPSYASALSTEDLGVRLSVVGTPQQVLVESSAGIVNEALESATRRAVQARGARPIPVFTYLANTIRRGDKQVPYSLITATDLGELGGSERSDAELKFRAPLAPSDPIVLNEWAARELGAARGDRIEVDYYLWDSTGGLTTHTATFTLDRVVAIAGLAADRRLAPDYPGITASRSLADWDPPFPIDLSRVRPEDERYWDQYRTTPKAFIPYERGRGLWRSRYGALTSVRFAPPAGVDAAAIVDRLRTELGSSLSPQLMGVNLYPARAAALEGARGATDFGEYFSYFSVFLVVAALLLTVLFFKLGVEQRLRQIGILRAAGFTIAAIRRLLVSEAFVVAFLGAVAGIAGAVLYGRLIVYGLRTWWVGAVGTTLIAVHVNPSTLALGAIGGVVAAVLCVVVSLRTIGRVSPRSLLMVASLENEVSADTRRARRRRLWAMLWALAGGALLVLGFLSQKAQAGAFFGAGACLLVSALLLLAAWLRARNARVLTGSGLLPVARLGVRSMAHRPARSVLSAALIASAVFIIVSVEAFRRAGIDFDADPHSGTGGYALLARSELPLLQDPNEPDGREALMIQAPELAGVRFTRFRVRQGDDASCLNLYRPTNPTLIAAEQGFIEAGRFSFSASIADSDAERGNPWLLLRRQFEDGAVPVIADATSLQYVLHAGVGDTMSIDLGGERPLVLRFVAALRDSVLQGELVMSEDQFVRHFPYVQGYRLILVDAPGVRSLADANTLAGIVEQELRPFGVDAVPTAERLAEFHRVENTYLSTFQALGGLGLILGTIGLATVMFRNVLERRRELALLRAVGYAAHDVTTLIVAEAAFLLGAGVLVGSVCAMVAIAPAWLGRGGTLPGAGLLVLLAAVVVAGLVSSMIATRAALRGKMLEALRSE
jgi:hypothetical protein